MARCINEVILLGYVGNDPESRAFGDRKVVNFSLATSESWKDKRTGEWKEATQWHRISAWTPVAETILKWVQKGSRVLVRGKVKYSKWKDREGQERTSTEIEVREVIVLEKAKAAEATKADEPQGPPDFSQMPKALENGEDDDLPF